MKPGAIRLGAAACLAGAVMAGGPAVADIIQIESDVANSTEGIGAFQGTIEYNFDAGLNGTLEITLTNTSDPANGGYITGLLFNINSSDPGASASLTGATDDDFLFAQGNGAPYGSGFDAGAALRGNFLGGGNPTKGIAVGNTETFTFLITASDAAILSAIDFIDGPFDFNFIVRTRGFNDGGSDKTPGRVVPTPGTLALAGIGLGYVGFGRRRRGH